MKIEYPRKFQIGFQEGTCPLACKKCLAFGPDAKRKKDVQKMSIDRAERLIDEIAGLGNHAVIQPHIFTEPFANPDLKRIICYCGEKELAMSIITNGVLLNNEWLDFLIDRSAQKITVSFSLDAVTQEIYEKVRGNYELSLIERNINYLIDHRKNKNLRIGVNFTVEDDNKTEKDKFLDKWKYHADAVRVHRIVGSDKMLDMPIEDEASDAECQLLNEVMIIDAGGEVRTCSWDAFGDSYLGNVFEQGICGVWNGKEMENLRRNICRGTLSKTEFCYGCGIHGSAANYVCRENDEFYIVDNGYDIFYNHK